MLNEVFFLLVELEQMLAAENKSLEDVPVGSVDYPMTPLQKDDQSSPMLVSHLGSGSGGYAESILKYAAKELLGIENYEVQFRQLRFVLLVVFPEDFFACPDVAFQFISLPFSFQES